MNKNLQKIVDATILNEDINKSNQLKILDSLHGLLEDQPELINDLKEYLTSQTQTASNITNELAASALNWLNRK